MRTIDNLFDVKFVGTLENSSFSSLPRDFNTHQMHRQVQQFLQGKDSVTTEQILACANPRELELAVYESSHGLQILVPCKDNKLYNNIGNIGVFLPQEGIKPQADPSTIYVEGKGHYTREGIKIVYFALAKDVAEDRMVNGFKVQVRHLDRTKAQKQNESGTLTYDSFFQIGSTGPRINSVHLGYSSEDEGIYIEIGRQPNGGCSYSSIETRYASGRKIAQAKFSGNACSEQAFKPTFPIGEDDNVILNLLKFKPSSDSDYSNKVAELLTRFDVKPTS